MKRNFQLFIASILFSNFTAFGQLSPSRLPAATAVKHYLLEASFNRTTVIILPSPVIDADRGYSDIIIEKQKGVENILKIKAATRNFSPTNVHIYGADGKVYPFTVQYSDTPYCTTFDLSHLSPEGVPALTFNGSVRSSIKVKDVADSLKRTAAFFSRHSSRYGIGLQLRTIHTADEILLFGFKLSNRSNLPFDIDFSQIYIRDRKKAKRLSYQREDLIPIYSDPVFQIGSDTTCTLMVALPKFVIPNKKEFFISFHEKNGGRLISLRIKNRHLLKARRL